MVPLSAHAHEGDGDSWPRVAGAGAPHPALAAVRTWPAAWPDPSPSLGAGVALLLIAKDRTIVREALVTLGQSAALARHARYSLERLARGQDEELALLARKAQQAATPR